MTSTINSTHVDKCKRLNGNTNGRLTNIAISKEINACKEGTRSSRLEGRKRKRTRTEINRLDILKGVSVCLTGLSAHQKTELHDLVVFLGGSFTRDLLTRRTTHLIAKPQQKSKIHEREGKNTTVSVGGEKIREALKHSRRIEILTPQWLEACKLRGARVPERDYRIFPLPDDGRVPGDKVAIRDGGVEMKNACDELLLPGKVPLNPLFSACYFFLVGFNDDEDGAGDSRVEDGDWLDTNGTERLLVLIRRGMGTVLWDLSECVTHVIVNGRDPKLRTAVYKFCRRHTNCPIPISPQWVISCLNNQRLVRANLYPPCTLATTTATNATHTTRNLSQRRPKFTVSSSLVSVKSRSSHERVASSTMHSNEGSTIQNQVKSIAAISSGDVDCVGMFEGITFHFDLRAPTTPPQSNATVGISFDVGEMEAAITSQGGQNLCEQVVNKLLRCKSEKNLSQPICYVVSLCREIDDSNIEDNKSDVNLFRTKDASIYSSPLLSKIRRVYKIVFVTPFWVEACLAQKMITPPEEYPILFKPRPWPIQKLYTKSGKCGGVDGSNGCNTIAKIAVTGFQGAERIGISRLIIAMGALYTETMGSRNTHLICKEAVGAKFEKAIEWGLHVVTVDWLYHVARFGYIGYVGDSNIGEKLIVDSPVLSTRKGCEDNFHPKTGGILKR